MLLEQINALWETDSKIDVTEAGQAAVDIAKLHHKYFKILSNERLLLRRYEADMKKLKLEKYEFYTQGPNEETQSKGWKLPAKGLILKADIPMYIDADDDIINLSLKIGLQQEKVEVLDSILRSIMNRSYHINAFIEWEKFKNGT
jgi:hypothetical protein